MTHIHISSGFIFAIGFIGVGLVALKVYNNNRKVEEKNRHEERMKQLDNQTASSATLSHMYASEDYSKKPIYSNGNKNNFGDIVIGTIQSPGGRCSNTVIGPDKAIIENTINLPNRDPQMLTSSMIVPVPSINDESRKKTRMDILNMFYNSMDDDKISIKSRPQGLYLIP